MVLHRFSSSGYHTSGLHRLQVARAEGELRTADRVLGVAQDLQAALAAPLKHLQQQLQRADRELLVRVMFSRLVRM